MINRRLSLPAARRLTLVVGMSSFALVACGDALAPPASGSGGSDASGMGGGATSGAAGASVTGGAAPAGGAAPVGGAGPTGGAAPGGGTGPTGGAGLGGAGPAGGLAGSGPSAGMGGTAGTGGAGMAGVGGSTAGAGGGTAGGGGAAGSNQGGSGGAGGMPAGDDIDSGPNTMGWIGCSMGENVATGYRRIGGTRMWGAYGNGGAVVQQWTDDNSSAWQRFDRQKGNTTLAAVWIMICIFTQGATDDEVDALIRNARSHAPGAYIYITGQPLYREGYTCTLAGEGGPELTDQRARDAADRHSDVHYAGALGPLNDNERSDVCHANQAGEDKLGRQVRAIWGQP